MKRQMWRYLLERAARAQWVPSARPDSGQDRKWVAARSWSRSPPLCHRLPAADRLWGRSLLSPRCCGAGPAHRRAPSNQSAERWCAPLRRCCLQGVWEFRWSSAFIGWFFIQVEWKKVWRCRRQIFNLVQTRLLIKKNIIYIYTFVSGIKKQYKTK